MCCYRRRPGSDLSESTIRWANLENTRFRNANLTKVALNGSGMSKELAELESQSCWRGRTFEEATMTNADLSNVRLPHATFSKADLTGSNVMQANLNDTSFAAAILTKAGFALAEAPNSEFHKADLRGAHFYRTDITGAHFKDVETDDSTKWPEDYPPPVEPEGS